MSERLRKTLVYGLFAAAIVWGIHDLRQGKEETAVNRSRAAPPVTAEITKVGDKSFLNIEDRLAERWGEDPFRAGKRRRTVIAGTDETGEPVRWILSGILYSKDNPLAYINWKAVRVGDTIADAKVVAIDRQTVTLEQKGNRFTISMRKG